MSVELISVLIAVLAVGATLGGLILTGNRGLRQDINDLRGKVVVVVSLCSAASQIDFSIDQRSHIGHSPNLTT